MRRLRKAPGRRYEHGVVAIEMAAVLPLLVLFITFPSVALAFYYRQYSAAQKAVHDAALYLATAEWVTGEVLDINGGAHLMRYPDLNKHVLAAFS